MNINTPKQLTQSRYDHLYVDTSIFFEIKYYCRYESIRLPKDVEITTKFQIKKFATHKMNAKYVYNKIAVR